MNIIRALFFVLSLLTAAPSYAIVINVNASDEYWSYHYSPIPFEAGLYRITPIGRDDGGAFNAWNAWDNDVSGCSSDGLCDRGWLDSYSFGYVEPGGFVHEIATIGGRVDQGTSQAYSSPLLALSHARTFDFELTSPVSLYFYLRDGGNWYYDNFGGMSLKIEPILQVPLPPSGMLMLCGLIVLVLMSRTRYWAMNKLT